MTRWPPPWSGPTGTRSPSRRGSRRPVSSASGPGCWWTGPSPPTRPARYCRADQLPLPGPHNAVNALVAAALARVAGVSAADIGAGLAGFRGGAHRTVLVGTVGGVDFVDDSKATNPHAAAASLTAYPRVVWIAGGLLKGADVDPLVAAVAPRLAGVVLLGRDREVLARSLARHAPSVPRIVVPSGDDVGVAGVTSGTGEAVMVQVVRAAAELARPGDTVLLAPAAASMDVFTDYGHRGRAFTDAVHALR